MKEVDRRTFLKYSAALATGIVVGELKVPVNIMVNEKVANATGHRTGNARLWEQLDETCKEIIDPQECIEKLGKPSTIRKVYGTFLVPPVEEYLYRGIPSEIVSKKEGREAPFKDILNGTGKISMTRRELFMGVASSIIFAAIHNLKYKGINTDIIPASQAFSGMVYWYLQRKLGILANTAAHITNNFRGYF